MVGLRGGSRVSVGMEEVWDGRTGETADGGEAGTSSDTNTEESRRRAVIAPFSSEPGKTFCSKQSESRRVKAPYDQRKQQPSLMKRSVDRKNPT